MPLISHELGMAYLASPKTASKATRQALQHQFGFTRQDGHHDMLRPPVDPSWTIFTTVRNHWDAWVSWFFFHGPRGLSFGPEWIDRFMDRYTRFYPDPGRMWGQYTDASTRILRYETLQDDLDQLFRVRVELPIVNAGVLRKKRHYSEFYDDEARDYVGTRFAKEIERYGYTYQQGE